ncbi:rhodanese-like domain-containing protein [Lacisediminimonas profundi]|uniref:rhodanese-like domain-containing protein n=1 Tax=Lacisediminimonas profundi TaxID=2603856 RepID=UPI00124AF232|nr:rhodanese-like domain-containing protein [Lacisediminimonas profundi]
MTTPEEILAAARERGQSGQFPYAGAVTPTEAHSLLLMAPKVKLVDVRTNAERDWVGRVLLPESQHLAVQWSLYPGGTPNPEFIWELNQVAASDDVLLFLCRSGVRSRHGAKLATEHGYANCFDILEGFEGDKDSHGHRKTVGGWCHAGMPWVGA